MREKSKQTLYVITVKLASGKTKEVPVKAASREVAERRALKKTQNGIDVLRNF